MVKAEVTKNVGEGEKMPKNVLPPSPEGLLLDLFESLDQLLS